MSHSTTSTVIVKNEVSFSNLICSRRGRNLAHRGDQFWKMNLKTYRRSRFKDIYKFDTDGWVERQCPDGSKRIALKKYHELSDIHDETNLFRR